MELIKYALKFRISFYVLAVLILLSGVGASIVMPKDVLPEVNIPVVVIVWTYTGLNAPDMEQRITNYTEISLSNNVNNIQRLESMTLQGTTIERVYFQPGVSIDLAIAQIVSAGDVVRSVLPPGINPPVVMQFSASAVPVIQLAMSSITENVKQLYDYAQYRIRETLFTAPGATIPPPYGGAPRQIMVDLDLDALQAHGLTPLDVTNAITAQNLVAPSGLSKMGQKQYVIRLNASPTLVDVLNRIPVKVVNGTPILIRDIGWVRDGSPPQTNAVDQDGRQGVLLTVMKNGNASTLDVVDNVKRLLPTIRAAAPKDMKITPLFDQSTFVAGAIVDVLREAVIAAGLTGAMIMLFLGSWRSTAIVLISIPLSILSSLAALAALGETINIMTLGGMALAVGILVDDGTVAIENTYRLMEQGVDFRRSVLEGAAGIAKPALISTLSICCAFSSVMFLADAPKFLFTPQALAVVFAMLASYLLSRTLVPILIDVLVKREYEERRTGAGSPQARFARFHAAFERQLMGFRDAYIGLLQLAIGHRMATFAIAGSTIIGAGILLLFVGQDYFPSVDAGQLTLHVRGRAGLRIEETQRLFNQIEDTIRETVGRDTGDVFDNIGLPSLNYNLAFNDGSFVAYNDGQVMVTLKPGHASTRRYMRLLRQLLRERFPDTLFYFQPADMITQILDFGVPSQIDVQVNGRHPDADRAVAGDIARRLRGVAGAVDVHVQQILDAPEFFVQVDRQRASELGLNEQQVTNNLSSSLSGSFQLYPNFWADPQTGIPYQLWVQTPEYRVNSLSDLRNTPMLVSTGSGSSLVQLLSNIATFQRGTEQTVINHVNTEPTYDVYAAAQDRDLGGIASDLARIVDDEQKHLPIPDRISIRGQIDSMNQAFFHIGIGLVVAIIAVYLLMVVNYQDWGDPFVVLSALPLVFSGIAASLFVTQTTFSIPSLMGAIMSVGVASANSILLVTFAREHRQQTGASAAEAAILAGATRLRPVLMTAGAMFVGLIPMAIGLGEGSEQNAALARAVLGGVAVGTCSTLLFVPFLYSVLRGGAAEAPKDYI